MITLSKSGSTVTFTFDENSGYLQNGTISVPVNSLSLVTDESDMATFRKSASNDIFVSARYEEFGMSKAELEAWYKANMVSSGGGGGGTGGTTPEEVQQMIDESISGKADTTAVTESISAVTESISAATDDMATQTWVGSQGYITGVDLSDYATLQDIPDVSNYFDGAEYDSGTTRINFYHGNTVKAYIDASAFVIDGMIDDVRIETISGVSYLVIDFNTASGKEDIQIPLTDIFNPDNYYDKTSVDGIVSGLNVSIDTKLDASAYTPTDLSEYWTSAQTQSAITSATNDMATQTWVNNQGFLTEHQSLSAYSTTEEMNSAIEEATSGKADTSAVTAVNNVLTAHTADTTIHVTSADKTAWNAKSDFSGSYNDLTDKPTIPTVPTSNTAFTNDAGYITSDALSGYAESSAVTEEISAAVSGKASQSDLETVSGAVADKQDQLVSGTNIKTINNESILGSGNITIQGGGSGSSTVELTQAEYDALVTGGTVDPTTYYIITDAQSVDISDYYTSAQTESAISAATSGKVDTSSVVTAVTSASTDSEIPTAKAVYDAVGQGGGGGGKAIEAGRGIAITTGATADTVSFNLPISGGSGSNSIIENSQYNKASGSYSHVEGSFSEASGNNSHAEGANTKAIGKYSHAEGQGTSAKTDWTHAEGYETVASGSYSHAEGYRTHSTGSKSHAEGTNTYANNYVEHACGSYNISNSATTTFGNSGNTLFSVGNGTADNARHNAFEIRQNGDIYFNDGTSDVKLQDKFSSIDTTIGDINTLLSQI